MVSKDYVEKQLKEIGFNTNSWGRAEVKQLPNIILPDEKIHEAVNGIYEGGFALLLATDVRVLLVDKKLMSFLTVEDLRFDMINEIDYNHRLIGSYITIATGSRTLIFRSYNKERLRQLIGHVQRCMAEAKKQQSSHVEGQSQHLEKINDQLQAYLVAQYKQQQELQEQLARVESNSSTINKPEPVRPPDELSNFLYARGLIDTYKRETGKDLSLAESKKRSAVLQTQRAQPTFAPQPSAENATSSPGPDRQLDEIYADGIQEVFGKHPPLTPNGQSSAGAGSSKTPGLEVNPIKIAYSKLPLALRNRKFGLPKPALPVYRANAASSPES